MRLRRDRPMFKLEAASLEIGGSGGTDPGLWSGLYLASTNKLFGCLVSGTLFSKLSKISRLPFFLVHLAALHSFFLYAWSMEKFKMSTPDVFQSTHVKMGELPSREVKILASRHTARD